MVTIINAADDEYELGRLDTVGPTLAICKEDGIIFNHQTAFMEKLLRPKHSFEEESRHVFELLMGNDVVLCLNANGMFADYASSWEDLSEFEEEDFYYEGTVTSVREGQLELETEDEDSFWIPFKHIDTIELGSAESDEPYEYED